MKKEQDKMAPIRSERSQLEHLLRGLFKASEKVYIECESWGVIPSKIPQELQTLKKILDSVRSLLTEESE